MLKAGELMGAAWNDSIGFERAVNDRMMGRYLCVRSTSSTCVNKTVMPRAMDFCKLGGLPGVPVLREIQL